jgi:hypothetical protein
MYFNIFLKGKVFCDLLKSSLILRRVENEQILPYFIKWVWILFGMVVSSVENTFLDVLVTTDGHVNKFCATTGMWNQVNFM